MESAIDAAVTVLVLLFSVVVHECAHGLAAERFGDDTARRAGRLTLNPVSHIDPLGSIIVPLVMRLIGGVPFGWAKPVPVNPRNLRNPRDHFPLVSAAGPAANLSLALLCAVAIGLLVGLAGRDLMLERAGDSRSAASFGLLVLYTGLRLNIVLALFNLIPLPPLDGSWILGRFLPPEGRRWIERIRPFGFFILLALLYLGLGRFLYAAVLLVAGPFLRLSQLIAGALL